MLNLHEKQRYFQKAETYNICLSYILYICLRHIIFVSVRKKQQKNNMVVRTWEPKEESYF